MLQGKTEHLAWVFCESAEVWSCRPRTAKQIRAVQKRWQVKSNKTRSFFCELFLLLFTLSWGAAAVLSILPIEKIKNKNAWRCWGSLRQKPKLSKDCSEGFLWESTRLGTADERKRSTNCCDGFVSVEAVFTERSESLITGN